jgi:Ca2+-binding RTX toxin-like protein
MATNYVGTEGDDFGLGGPGENLINGGPGNDEIIGIEGVNTIQFAPGDGVDTVSYAPPRPYQFANFLAEATRALQELNSGAPYDNTYLRRLPRTLISELPTEIASVLNQLRNPETVGSVDPQVAQTAFESLAAWINEPTRNVIEFGAGITPADISLQIGSSTTCFGLPTQFAVAVNGQDGIVFSLGRADAVAGSTSTPPVLDITFRFADGTEMTAADVLAMTPSGVIGTQFGGEDGEVLRGSLTSDEIHGNGGDDRIDAGGGRDTVYGGGGNDAIQGGAGWDMLYGGDGDDVLAASRDGVYMSGGAGNDVYLINRGDGGVSIEDWGAGAGEVNTLSFGPGITPSMLTAYVDPWSGYLNISIAGSADSVSMPWFDIYNGNAPIDSQQIQQIQFVDADGNAQVFNLAQLVTDRTSDLLGATYEAPATLFPADASAYQIAASGVVGGEYATNYARTGDMFDAGTGGEAGGGTDPGPVNHAPVASTGSLSTGGDEDASFSYTLPDGTFTDADAGDSMTLTATLADGSPLPGWLAFDAASGTFSGTPTNGDVGTLQVRVTATDAGGLSATKDVSIAVSNVNDAPAVAAGLADASAAEEGSFEYTVPANTFSDNDAGDVLTLSATLANGDALPAWLQFDAASGTFSGSPANSDVGELSIRVTATDSVGASASSTFSVSVLNVNDAPVVSMAVAGQTAAEDAAFSFTIPDGTFTDVDAGDSLTLSATLADGSALPGWLTFDAASGTFSGTPANGDVGTLSVRVTATDRFNGSTHTDFSIAVTDVNDAPVVSMAVADQAAEEDAAFSFTIPAGTFADVDAGDSLTLSVTLADGGELPGWLHFDAATGTFSGTPANGDVGTLSLKVTATDGANASVSTSLSLTVANVNDAPVVTMAAADATASEDSAFSYTLPSSVFGDVDAGDTLALSATLANGSALPGWLSFDAATRTFSGTPGNADVGTLSVRVTATDAAGASAADTFDIVVANTNDAPVVNRAIADANGTAGQAMSMTLAGDTFRDIDVGDGLTLSATLADGSALPAWLQFDAATRTFSGTPAAAGTMNISVRAMDRAGASAEDSFTLTVAAPTPDPEPGADADQTLIGTRGNDTLVGGSGDDYLRGGRGQDVLLGNDGDDTLRMSRDNWWTGGATRTHNGSPGIAGSGERVSISGLRQSNDIFDGGAGYDTLQGSGSADAILLDDIRSPAAQSGPRIRNIERIDAGSGDDVVDLTSQRYSYGNVTVDGGDGNDVIWSSSGDDVLLGGGGNDRINGGSGRDYLFGGSGRDTLVGGRGLDIMQGGSGNDTLTDSWRGLMDGGSGDDVINDGWGRALILGGTGNDTIKLGGGADVIAFNRGDGRDLIQSGRGGDATLSLGGGIRVSDLWLSRRGNDLVLEIGRNDRITFDDWYNGRNHQPISKLQLITDGNGATSITNDQVETFDFRKIVSTFDQTRGVSRWSMTNAMAKFHLGGSDEAAMGGDLAFQYGTAGSLAGVSLAAAQATTGADQFGTQAQSISNPSLKEGLVKLA